MATLTRSVLTQLETDAAEKVENKQHKYQHCCCGNGSSPTIKVRSISHIAYIESNLKSYSTIFHGPFSPALSSSGWTFGLEIPLCHEQGRDTLAPDISFSIQWLVAQLTPLHHHHRPNGNIVPGHQSFEPPKPLDRQICRFILQTTAG